MLLHLIVVQPAKAKNDRSKSFLLVWAALSLSFRQISNLYMLMNIIAWDPQVKRFKIYGAWAVQEQSFSEPCRFISL